MTLISLSCQKDKIIANIDYFPETDTWETLSLSQAGFDDSKVENLKKVLQNNNTRAFLLLKDGKIVIEEYFNKDLLGKDFNQNSTWYWASAGKTLTATTVGIAQENGKLDINETTQKYLGKDFTSLTNEKESLITIRHQLTMTSGLDMEVHDSHCFEPQCLQYKADAGTRWDYHNGSYTLLHEVITNATGTKFEDYFNQNLRDKIGMDGFWQFVQNDHVYFSKPRSMARFGQLILNKGEWNGETIIKDKKYLNDMLNTSQNLNQAYGYLWWLNGKSSGMVPGVQVVFKQSITPSAPAEMVAAMGKNGQLINIIPSKKIVMIRMGETAETGQIGFEVQREIWDVLSQVVK